MYIALIPLRRCWPTTHRPCNATIALYLQRCLLPPLQGFARIGQYSVERAGKSKARQATKAEVEALLWTSSRPSLLTVEPFWESENDRAG